MSARRRAVALVALGLVVGLAGCGSSEPRPGRCCRPHRRRLLVRTGDGQSDPEPGRTVADPRLEPLDRGGPVGVARAHLVALTGGTWSGHRHRPRAQRDVDPQHRLRHRAAGHRLPELPRDLRDVRHQLLRGQGLRRTATGCRLTKRKPSTASGWRPAPGWRTRPTPPWRSACTTTTPRAPASRPRTPSGGCGTDGAIPRRCTGDRQPAHRLTATPRSPRRASGGATVIARSGPGPGPPGQRPGELLTGRPPLEPGNLALVQLLADVPWVYNEMGAKNRGGEHRPAHEHRERKTGVRQGAAGRGRGGGAAGLRPGSAQPSAGAALLPAAWSLRRSRATGA